MCFLFFFLPILAKSFVFKVVLKHELFMTREFFFIHFKQNFILNVDLTNYYRRIIYI